jgi:hypothetical protein
MTVVLVVRRRAMGERILQEVHPYIPYAVALFIFWLFTRIYGGHVSHLLKELFDEVRALATGRPFVAVMNFIGGFLLFLLVILFFAEVKFDIIYAGSPPPASDKAVEHAMLAALIFLFAIYFLLCLALTRHNR